MGNRTDANMAANAQTLELPEIEVPGYRVEYLRTSGIWTTCGTAHWELFITLGDAIDYRNELQAANPNAKYRVVRVLRMTEVLPV